MDEVVWLLLVLGAFAGSMVQAATGFGFAIVAAPLFLIALNAHAALQVLVVIHLVQTLMMLGGIWPIVPRGLFRALVIGALIGSPVGLVLFMYLDVRQLKLAIGGLILGLTALLLAKEAGWFGRPAVVQPETGASRHEGCAPLPRLGYITGAVSGAMTALLVMPGPPLMVHLANHPLPHVQARALAIAFFGLCYLVVTALNTFWAGMGPGVWSMALILSPVVVGGTLLGQYLAHFLTQGLFRMAVLALLVLSGVSAVLSAL